MEETKKEVWLVLDDSITDRRRMVLAIENEITEAIPVSTVTEALEILQTRDITGCILDFFLRGTSSQTLISDIRKKYPTMPILVVSTYAGKEDRIYKAGADEVLPKVSDLNAFVKIVQNSLSRVRVLKLAKLAPSSLFGVKIFPAFKAEFEKAKKSLEGNVIVFSDNGMGKSTLARILATEFLNQRLNLKKTHFETRPKILFYNCVSETTEEKIIEDLFGTNRSTVGLLGAAKNSVLIIEDIHFMPHKVQEKLRTYVLKSKIKFFREKLNENLVPRIVFTYNASKSATGLILDFEKDVAQQIVQVPHLQAQVKDSKAILDFFVQKNNVNQISVEKDLLKILLDKLKIENDFISFKSLNRALESAFQIANSERTGSLRASHFGNFELLVDNEIDRVQNSQNWFELPFDDRIGVAAWKNFYALVREGTLQDGENYLRKLMFEYAMLRHRGNKSRVADQLGIKRQSLYKEGIVRLQKLKLSKT
jgi:DNA-binding NtrC family response regulator